ASRVGSLAISWRHVWIPKGGEPRFAFRKFTNSSQWHPGEIGIPAPARNREEKKLYDRHRQCDCNQSVEQKGQLRQQPAASNDNFIRHRRTPSAARFLR